MHAQQIIILKWKLSYYRWQ